MACCNSQNTTRRSQRYRCPRNGREYRAVPTTTVLHHLKQPWRREIDDHQYYFCTDPACPVIYFTDDDAIFEQDALRTPVGLKAPSPDALICYCFGVTRAEAGDPATRAFVTQQTRTGNCACEIRNPSGRCCLSDFPKH